MNISICISTRSKSVKEVSEIIKAYVELRKELKKTNPDVVMNIEVRVD